MTKLIEKLRKAASFNYEDEELSDLYKRTAFLLDAKRIAKETVKNLSELTYKDEVVLEAIKTLKQKFGI